MTQRTARSRTLLFLVLAVVALLGAACGSDDSSSSGPAPGEETAVVALATKATPIDVRTPEEFGAGHIEGAANLDVQSAGFDSLIADLDPEATYVVYCRSGNRSAAAAVRMRDAGLTVLDGGGLDDMVAAGWPQGA